MLPIRCEDARESLADLVYGDSTDPGLAAAVDHVAQCASCGAELAAMRSARERLAALPALESPLTSDEIRALQVAAPRRWRGIAWAAGIAAIAAAALMWTGVSLERSPGGVSLHFGAVTRAPAIDEAGLRARIADALELRFAAEMERFVDTARAIDAERARRLDAALEAVLLRQDALHLDQLETLGMVDGVMRAVDVQRVRNHRD